MSVTPATPTPGPPKKTDDKSFFDVSINYELRLDCCVINFYILTVKNKSTYV